MAQRHLDLLNVSSSFLFRSGLDGHSIYLKSTFAPYFNAISEQHIGNCISLMSGVVILIAVMKNQRSVMLKQLLFNLIPFAFVYMVFPQMCTIHGYLAEFLFVTPCVFLLSYWLLSFKIKDDFPPTKFVYAVFFLAFLLMGQLMEIAKTYVLDNLVA
jgi:heme/copper-type cytochrome/quinol oxidase subunit 1